MSSVLNDLKARGLLEQVSDPALGERLEAGCVTFYVGFDPTAPSLQIGNLCTIIAMRRLQRAGHKPVAIVGGGTGMIGDPSGKSSERNLLDAAALERNLCGQRAQLERLLDFRHDTPAGAIMLNNLDWLGRFSFIDFLRDVGKRFRLGEMLAKESVKRRLESPEGMSFTEFSYQMLQAYDFMHLHREHGVQMQLGGSDQWGNITAGIDLVRKECGAQAFGLVIPLVTDSQGRKFGKSEGNAIYLDPGMTPPVDMYQYLVNSDDESVIRYLKAFTFFSLDEINTLAEEARARPEKRVAQKALAFEIVRMVHGIREAQAAEKAALDNFGAEPLRTALAGTPAAPLAALLEAAGDGAPRAEFPEADPTGFDLPDLIAATGSTDFYRNEWHKLADTPTPTGGGKTISDLSIPRADLDAGVNIIDLLVQTPLFSSKGDARRMIQQGGAYLNDIALSDIAQTVTTDDLQPDGTLAIRKGKKRRCLIQAE